MEVFVLYCIVLYCIILYCIVLYCGAASNLLKRLVGQSKNPRLLGTPTTRVITASPGNNEDESSSHNTRWHDATHTWLLDVAVDVARVI